MSRTGTLGRLFGHAGEPCVELHPQELARRKWRAGDLLRLFSRRGELVLLVQPSEAVARAQAFVAMHWGEEFVGGVSSKGAPMTGVNGLTTGEYCAQSKQPELKHTAVRLQDAGLPWGLLAAAWLPAGAVLAIRTRLRELFGAFGYASCVPFGREPGERVGLLLRAAAVEPVPDGRLARIEQALGLDGKAVLRYADPRRGQHCAMRQGDEGEGATLRAFLLAGDTQAQAWVLPLLQQEKPARSFGRALLASSATPPTPLPARASQVCNCLDVDEGQIRAVLATAGGSEADRLALLQGRLRCGTSCGSCLPALRSFVRERPIAAPPSQCTTSA